MKNGTLLYFFTFLILLSSINIKAQNEVIDYFLEGIKITDIKSDGVDLWVTTEGDGIYHYIKWKNKWVNFSTKNKKIKQNFFYCIEVGPRYVWAGSADGLYIYDKKRKRWRKKRFSLGGQFGNWIRSLKYDKKENKLWIGRFKYLSQYDLITKKYSDIDLTVNKNAKTNSITSISIDGDSLLWIGAEIGIHKLIKYDDSLGHKTSFYDSKDNYFMNEGDHVSITNVIFDQKYIWFGTDEFITNKNPQYNVGGLFRFDREINWVKFDEHSIINGNGIYSLEIAGNYIWVSTYHFDPRSKNQIGKGVSLINRKTLEILKIQNDLIPENVYSLHFDGKNIWFGTSDGLRRISLTNLLIADFSL